MSKANPAMIEAVEAEIERIRTLTTKEARVLWRSIFQKEAPKALTRDLLVRMLTWDIQEKAFGGHNREVLRILDSYAKGKPADTHRGRRFRPGTEIIREYQGERHTVTVTVAGFRWREKDYPSLTAVARIITGTSCNGPRFFGLRPVGSASGSRADRRPWVIRAEGSAAQESAS